MEKYITLESKAELGNNVLNHKMGLNLSREQPACRQYIAVLSLLIEVPKSYPQSLIPKVDSENTT